MFMTMRLTVLLTVLASFTFADDRVRISTVPQGVTQALLDGGRFWDELPSIQHQDGRPWTPCEYFRAPDKELFVPARPVRDRVKTLALIAESRNCAKSVSPVALASTPKQQPAKPLIQAQPVKTEAQSNVQTSPVPTKFQPSTAPLTPRAKETAMAQELSSYKARLSSAEDALAHAVKVVKDDMAQNYIPKVGAVPKAQHERELATTKLVGGWSAASAGLIGVILGFFGSERFRSRKSGKNPNRVKYIKEDGSPDEGMPVRVREVLLEGNTEATPVCRLITSHYEISKVESLEYRKDGWPRMPFGRELSAVEMQNFTLHRMLDAWIERQSGAVEITAQDGHTKRRRVDVRRAIA